jgi:putative DNA primase/helicase
VSDVLDALVSVCLLDGAQNQPSWLDGRSKGPGVSCTNGLLEVAGRVLLPHSPLFFNVVRVPFNYDAEARARERWLRFLAETFEGNTESIAAL